MLLASEAVLASCPEQLLAATALQLAFPSLDLGIGLARTYLSRCE